MTLQQFALSAGIGLVLWLASAGPAAVAADRFSLASPDVQAGGTVAPAQVYAGYGCNGKNISPALSWRGAPSATRSYAVTVFDPDAPTGKGWWHWLIFDIPATTGELPANAGDVASGLAPKDSVQSLNDFGATGYGGPCPPPGDPPHHYVFTVYALDVPRLSLDASSAPETVRDTLEAHALANASLTARYGR